MTIVINALSVSHSGLQVMPVVQKLIHHYPEFKWIILLSAEGESPAGVTETEYYGKPLSNGLANHIQVSAWVKKMIRKYKPKVVLNIGDRLIKVAPPQISLYPRSVYFREPDRIPVSYKRYHSLWHAPYFKSLSQVIVVSEKEKQFLIKKFRISSSVISPIAVGASSTTGQITYDEREAVKDQYSGGYEFFLCTDISADGPALMNLLKAFSAFKKRQKSGMQLLLAGADDLDYNAVENLLRLYKYKEDVRLVKNSTPDMIQKLLQAAYAVVFMHSSDNRSNELFTALRAGVPSLVVEESTMHELGKNAAEPFEVGNIAVLAGKMMLLFKDERYRKKLITNSQEWLETTSETTGIKAIGDLIKNYSKA